MDTTFVDSTFNKAYTGNGFIKYRLITINNSSITGFSDTVQFNPLSTTDLSNKINILPNAYKLTQNYPNPFNPSTTISYALPEDSYVKLTVYNILGQKVAVLANSEELPGIHQISWTPKLSSGIYFYNLSAVSKSNASKKFFDTKKMIILK
jgi:hypothetical protein